MALSDAEQEEVLAAVRATRVAANVAGYRIDALVSGKGTYDNQMGDKAAPNRLQQQLAESKLREEAILRAVTGADRSDILAAIAAEGTQIRADLAAQAAADAQRDAELSTRIIAALPSDDGPVSRDDLVAALRTVLGSVDGATPQG